MFQQESLALIQSLTERLAAIPGVDRVRSLTNVEEVKGTAWGIELSLLLDALPQDEEEAARLRRRVLEDDSMPVRLYRGMEDSACWLWNSTPKRMR